MKWLVSAIFLFFGFCLSGQQLRIGLLRDYNLNRITFSYNNAPYYVYGDSILIDTIFKNEFIETLKLGKRVLLKKGVEDIGDFERVYLVQDSVGSSITINCKDPSVKQRKYQDDFELFVGDSGISIVNNIDIDRYVAGVVESEGGVGWNIEYYKVQAIISRSYALKYKDKHAKEGFGLCDRVHCQAYLNMLRYSTTIDSAVQLTKNLVLIDGKDYLIDAYFHANCGGQTFEPQYVWNSSLPYLKTRLDTFCIYTKQAEWEKRISKTEWSNFLIKNYNYPIKDSLFNSLIYEFDQQTRKAFYIDPVLGIPLRDIRDKFALKSTFFSCRPEGDDVVLSGRGYGHGVGLCQEGAMKMAKLGYSHGDILQFYFPGANLLNIQSYRFYRQTKNDGF